jgi:hypothetical protein
VIKYIGDFENNRSFGIAMLLARTDKRIKVLTGVFGYNIMGNLI